ncbi:glutamate receptor ionotropic, delta-1 [Caerostris extrusa]|uniref:Glutamate receptor ionotropic, delta-1 n=1 Tax=Caerostris extrusa TaxID=172846 RepID=A0AAV4UAM7_CAEEX|nr:glutamate receptor ionotropic, delta-1 [Caerostris extrusa]
MIPKEKFLQIVLEALKIKYEIVISKDMLYGDPLPDGNFTGMVGMVQREEVDLAMTYLAMNEIRSKVVNFSMPYYADRISFITSKPENSKQNLALLYVSDAPTWIAMVIVLIVMSVLFAKFKGSVGNNLFRLMGTVVGQSLNIGNGSLRSRILLAAWLLLALVISLSYSVTLLSHLIQPAKVAPIRTFHELSRAVQSGGHTLYAIKTYIPFLLDSEEDHLKELGKIVVYNKWITPSQTYEETYRIPHQTSHIRARIIASLALGNRDDIFTSDDELCVLPIAFAYNNNFCCKAKLNAILSKLWSSGLYKSYCKTLHSNRF